MNPYKLLRSYLPDPGNEAIAEIAALVQRDITEADRVRWAFAEIIDPIEMARRLAEILGPSLSHLETVALLHLLTSHYIEFEDGFGTHQDPGCEGDAMPFDRNTGAAIASCFCAEPDEDWRWWKAELSSGPWANLEPLEDYRSTLLDIFRRVRDDPTVSRIDGWLEDQHPAAGSSA